MNSAKMFQGWATAEIDNLLSITPIANGADTLGGRYFTFYARGYDGLIRKFVPYFVSGSGVGTDPTLGFPESDTIITHADSAGTTASKYFVINEGTSAGANAYYTTFTVNNNGVISGYDPRVGVNLMTNVSVRGDTAGNLGGKYFTFFGGAGDTHYAYFIDDDKPQYAADPAAGQKAVTTLTINAARFATGGDSARADTTLNGNYLYLAAPTQNGQNYTYFFPWFNNGNGVNPRLGRAQVQTLACTGDTSGAMAGQYFLLGDSNISNYFWYQVGGGGANPSLPGLVGKLISISSGDSAGLVARKTKDVIQADSSAYSTTRLTNVITITNKAVGVPPVAFSAGTTHFTATVPIASVGINKDSLLAGDSTVGAGDSIAYANGDSAQALFLDVISYLKLAGPSTVFSWTGDSVKKALTITAKSFGNTGVSSDGIYPTQFGIVQTKKGFVQQTGLANAVPVHIYTGASNAVVAAQLSASVNQNFPVQFTTSLTTGGDTVILSNDVAGNVTAVADGTVPNNTSFKFVATQAGVSKLAGLASASLLATVPLVQGDSNGTVAQKLAYALVSAGYKASRVGATVTLTHKQNGNPTNGIINGTAPNSMPVGWTFFHVTSGVDLVRTGGDSAVSIAIPVKTGATVAAVTTALQTALTNVPLNTLVNPVVQASGDTIFVTNIYKGSINPLVDGTAPRSSGFTFLTKTAGADTTFSNMARNTGPVTTTYYIKPSPDQVIYLRKGFFEISLKGDSVANWSGFGDTTALPNGLFFEIQDINGNLVGNALSPTITTNAQFATLGQTQGDGNRLQVMVDFPGLYGGDPFGELVVDGTKGQKFAIVIQDNLNAYVKNFYFHGYGHYQASIPY